MLGIAAVSDRHYHNLRIQLRGVTICDEMTDQQYNQVYLYMCVYLYIYTHTYIYVYVYV
jgi:hypothetical protein